MQINCKKKQIAYTERLIENKYYMKHMGRMTSKLNFKRALAAATVALALIAATGCADTESKEVKAQEGNIGIVTSFYPVYIATINITKDIQGVNVSNMTESQTGCLHDYTLSAKDMKKLSGANVFIINGAGMESFMDKTISQYPQLKIINSSEGIALLKDEASGLDNPHIWVSITGAIEQAKNIGKQLAAVDTKHAAQYEKNTAAYVGKLEALKTKMHQKLDGLQNKNIVTFHEAFPYFAKEFNLNIKAVIECEPGTEPSAKELAETVEIIKATGVKALFAEPQYSQKAAELIARDTGAKVYILDPVVTGEANGDTDAYIKVMEANLTTLEEALSN